MRYSNVSNVFVLRDVDTHSALDYVGYWSEQDAIIVAHEGTDPTQL